MRALTYQCGFANYQQSEALPGALVHGCNSPQQVPYGLYAEQLSGSAFTALRSSNIRSWLYRIRPSVTHGEFTPYAQPTLIGASCESDYTPPTQLRWDPMPYPSKPTHFIEGWWTVARNGSPASQTGASIHLYCANRSMDQTYFFNADGEMLIVPQEGALLFKTEFGTLEVNPGEIIVIPRGVTFQVCLLQDTARGYICENSGAPFRLPELGVIGANGLANPRDFLSPHAAYEEREGHFQVLNKFQGSLWETTLDHSPLNVVAWHGNYYPYKYDLRLFNAMNSVSFDHADPSIFTVLTSPSFTPGVANVDFVIFPERWVVSEDTFRPPYFHRNIMSEFMGLVFGQYDAKKGGFVPGGSSLHNCMTAHGPDADAYRQAVQTPLKPEYYAGTLAFMFESSLVWRLTKQAFDAKFRQKDYLLCWKELKSNFRVDSFTTLS